MIVWICVVCTIGFVFGLFLLYVGIVCTEEACLAIGMFLMFICGVGIVCGIMPPTEQTPMYEDVFIDDIVTYEDNNDVHHVSTIYYKNVGGATSYIKEHNGEIISISDYKLRDTRYGQDGVLIVWVEHKLILS